MNADKARSLVSEIVPSIFVDKANFILFNTHCNTSHHAHQQRLAEQGYACKEW